MIYKALNIITQKFENYLTGIFQNQESHAIMKSPGSLSDGINGNESSTLAICLINMERDTSMGVNFKQIRSTDSGLNYTSQPPISLNLYLLVAADFPDKNYPEAIKYLSAALQMIQSDNLYTSDNTPELGTDILQLHLELENTSFQELTNIWSMLGGKYLPSFLLKVRLITIDQNQIKTIERPANEIKLTL